MQSEADFDEEAPPSGQQNPYWNLHHDEDLESPPDSEYAPSDNGDSGHKGQHLDLAPTRVHRGPLRWHSRQDGERRNRFSGDHRVWMRLTDADRQVAASLDYLQNTDLSIHIYNAFMVRKRMSEQGSDWAPPKLWTAWPLTSPDVPRSDQPANAMFDPRFHQPLSSRQELEELMIAFTTAEARKWFMARQGTFLKPGPTPTNKPPDRDTREQSRSKEGISSTKQTFESNAPSAESSGDRKRSTSQATIRQNLPSTSKQKDPPTKLVKSRIDLRFGPLATPSTDETKSERILQPMMRQIQSDFDTVLMALHRSRQIHVRGREHSPRRSSSRSPRHPSSSSTASSASSSTDRSRSRSIESAGTASSSGSRSPSRSSSGSSSSFRLSDFVSDDEQQRQSDVMAEDPGDPENDNGNLEDDLLGSSQESVEPHDTKGKKEKRPPRSVKNLERERRARLGLRDWSEVLGMAAISAAFSPHVVERARQRCAALFDQDMGLRVVEQETKDKTFTVMDEEIADGVRVDGFPERRVEAKPRVYKRKRPGRRARYDGGHEGKGQGKGKGKGKAKETEDDTEEEDEDVMLVSDGDDSA